MRETFLKKIYISLICEFLLFKRFVTRAHKRYPLKRVIVNFPRPPFQGESPRVFAIRSSRSFGPLVSRIPIPPIVSRSVEEEQLHTPESHPKFRKIYKKTGSILVACKSLILPLSKLSMQQKFLTTIPFIYLFFFFI